LDGFAMSRLAPYENWNAVRDEARRLWDIYRSIAKPSKLIRLAVRYINRIDMPLPLGDFKDYLRTVPDVSPDLPQGLAYTANSFRHRVKSQRPFSSPDFINQEQSVAFLGHLQRFI
jgi:uncharacterized protein (TIGR04255 family)